MKHRQKTIKEIDVLGKELDRIEKQIRILRKRHSKILSSLTSRDLVLMCRKNLGLGNKITFDKTKEKAFMSKLVKKK